MERGPCCWGRGARIADCSPSRSGRKVTRGVVVDTGGWSREPLTADGLACGRQYIRMDGRAVFKWAVRMVNAMATDVVRHAELTMDDIDLVVMHQANRRILDAAVDGLGVDRDKVFVNLDRYGNTTAASIPIVLDEAVAAGRLRRGDHVLLMGFVRRSDVGRWCAEVLMGKTQRLRNRDQVAVEDTWDLASLFQDDAAWEEAFQRYERRIKGYEKFRGKLGTSAAVLAKCLEFDSQLDRLGERLGVYAFLRTAEDQTNSGHQRMLGRFQNVATRAVKRPASFAPNFSHSRWPGSTSSWPTSPSSSTACCWNGWCVQAPHARQPRGRVAGHAGRNGAGRRATFRQLHDADLKFGFVRNEKGEKIELSNATFSQLLHSPKRTVRREPFTSTTPSSPPTKIPWRPRSADRSSRTSTTPLASTPVHSMPHSSPTTCRRSVYDNLIDSVRQHLPAVHHYYDVAAARCV